MRLPNVPENEVSDYFGMVLAGLSLKEACQWWQSRLDTRVGKPAMRAVMRRSRLKESDRGRQAATRAQHVFRARVADRCDSDTLDIEEKRYNSP